jgi:hypothetical protein
MDRPAGERDARGEGEHGEGDEEAAEPALQRCHDVRDLRCFG